MVQTAELDVAPDTIDATLNYIVDDGTRVFTITAGPGGQDVRSGGTWLVVDPAARALAVVFTPGAPTPDTAGLRTRGELPLLALADPTLGVVDPTRYEPFALLRADVPTGALIWWTWDRSSPVAWFVTHLTRLPEILYAVEK